MVSSIAEVFADATIAEVITDAISDTITEVFADAIINVFADTCRATLLIIN